MRTGGHAIKIRKNAFNKSVFFTNEAVLRYPRSPTSIGCRLPDHKVANMPSEKPSLKKQFGRRLQQVRSSIGVTQEELAARVELTVESISNMERGIHGPGFDNLEKIALALKVPVKTLFEFDTK